MFRSLRNMVSNGGMNSIERRSRQETSCPTTSPFPEVTRSPSEAARNSTHLWPSPDDEPPPPYSETPTTSDTHNHYLPEQTAPDPASETQHTTPVMIPNPVPANESSVNTTTSERLAAPTDAQRTSFYGRINPSITGGFSTGAELGAGIGRVAGLSADHASTDVLETQIRQPFRYKATSEDIMTNFEAFPPSSSVSGQTPRPPPASVSSTPRMRGGYSKIPASILDDFTGTLFSGVEDTAQHPSNAPHNHAPEGDPDFSFGQHYHQTEVADDHNPAVVVSRQRIHASGASDQKDCPICAETKSSNDFPIFSVTPTCLHAPEACLECLRMAIQTELNNRHWKDIRCPECRELLEYVDVQRYADKQTFTRYENLALRAAMHQADNFIWCSGGCGSGQIHDTGIEQPIVICLHCSRRSCFTHEVAWHDGLTCDEYDSLLADPENFRSRIEIENAAIEEEEARRRAQDAADHAMATGLAAAQEAEERARLQRDMDERKRVAKAAEEARQAAARRKREDEKSIAMMDKTTKQCPGCSWAIEKNRGCSHMTCLKCKYEFCWECLANHRRIMTKDNSAHERNCKFHPDNLDEEYMGDEDQAA